MFAACGGRSKVQFSLTKGKYNFVKQTSVETCIIQRTRNERSFRGKANKSARGMPWHQEPKKDVTSCDKPRGAANKL